jgi:DNA-binding transcriptional MerR regulator
VDITEVARRSGLPASTLRFMRRAVYEEKGLIASIGRRVCTVCSIPERWNDWR